MCIIQCEASSNPGDRRQLRCKRVGSHKYSNLCDKCMERKHSPVHSIDLRCRGLGRPVITDDRKTIMVRCENTVTNLLTSRCATCETEDTPTLECVHQCSSLKGGRGTRRCPRVAEVLIGGVNPICTKCLIKFGPSAAGVLRGSCQTKAEAVKMMTDDSRATHCSFKDKYLLLLALPPGDVRAAAIKDLKEEAEAIRSQEFDPDRFSHKSGVLIPKS